MKKVTVVIPTYNEEGNVEKMVKTLTEIFEDKIKNYDYEILFIDNRSEDQTRDIIRRLAENNRRIKAIFNSNNFGWIRSPLHGLRSAEGDCAILMAADFQDPPSLIPEMIRSWEEGNKVVVGIKKSSKENPLMFLIRRVYYRFIEKLSEVHQISQFTGFGLYDRQFLDALRGFEDPIPYLKGIVPEIGFQRKEIEFVQNKREAGISKSNFWRLFDYAMLGITSNTKVLVHLAAIFGFIISGLSMLVAIAFFVLKLLRWNEYPMGMTPLLIGMFFFGGIEVSLIALIGEYVMTANIRAMRRPLVIEEERINFDKQREE